jgi:hypothetical protein
MPKKRTRQQKIRAQYHYALPANRSFSGVDNDASNSVAGPALVKKTDVMSLYHYDPIFIVRDIRWTMIASLFILAAQLGLYLWLK